MRWSPSTDGSSIAERLMLSVAVGGVLVIGIVAAAAILADGKPVRLLVVDTDGGADDAFALMTLLRAEKLQISFSNFVPRLVAVTCVQGNTGVTNVTRNVFATLNVAGRLDVPVYTGAPDPLLPPPTTYTAFYGWDGFGDFLPPGQPAGQPQPEHAAVGLVRLAKEHAGQLTLVCIGPLTNVALAVKLDPSFIDNLRALYILGGAAHGVGNVSPGAEFNWQTDPDAAMVVLEAISADKPAYLVPLESCMEAHLPLEWRLNTLGSVATAAMSFLNQVERVALDATTGPWECADGLMAAFAMDAVKASVSEPQYVGVLGGTGPGRGVSLVDYTNTTGLPGNVVIVEQLDTAAFQRALLRLLA